MSHASVDELLEQGRIALTGLKYREQAALFHAASASLQSALRNAEAGDPHSLEVWLERHRGFLAECELLDRESFPTTLDFPLPASNVVRFSNEVRSTGVAENQEIDPPQNSSPWEEMERCSRERLEANPLPCESSEVASAMSESLGEECESTEQALEQDKATCFWEGSKEEGSEQSDFGLSSYEADECDSQDPFPEEGFVDGELSDEALVEARVSDVSPIPHERKLNWRSFFTPPIWMSLGVHSVLIACLSFIVIQQIRDTEKVAIVSAPYESEGILTETPMESISNLEAPAMEAFETTAALYTGTTVGESLASATMPAIDVPAGIGGGLRQGISSETLSSALKSSPGTPGGSKTGTGTEFFGVKATGNLFIYVVDCSPSMRRDNAFEAAKMEIARSLQSMKSDQRYYIYFFGKEVERLELSLGVTEEFPVQATEKNVLKTMEWLGRAAIQREGLPPNDALTEAIKLQPDGIFLLFDGDTRVDVAKHLGQINRATDILSSGEPKVPIHVVHFFLEEFSPSMKRIALENSGTYRFIPRQATPRPKRNSFNGPQFTRPPFNGPQ